MPWCSHPCLEEGSGSRWLKASALQGERPHLLDTIELRKVGLQLLTLVSWHLFTCYSLAWVGPTSVLLSRIIGSLILPLKRSSPFSFVCNMHFLILVNCALAFGTFYVPDAVLVLGDAEMSHTLLYWSAQLKGSDRYVNKRIKRKMCQITSVYRAQDIFGKLAEWMIVNSRETSIPF